MKLAIVAYPSLDEADRQWIESFRALHDPQARRIEVHFTLVFPFEAMPDDIAPEVASVARSSPAIAFATDQIKVVPDAMAGGSHVFLVPGEGGADIAALHDRLYAGALRNHLRSDPPFLPHMTIGAAQDHLAAERLADELGRHVRILRGALHRIELIDVGTRSVRTIGSYALGKQVKPTVR
jgi:2'-5' RNA ligase